MADRDDDMDYIEGEEIMEGDVEDASIACSCPDCDEEAKMTCAGCGVASYCSEVHMLSDWKTHIADCNVCINHGMIGAHGGVYWAAEVADEATDKANTVQWEPADMLHVRASSDGTLVEGRLNTDLLASMQDRKTVGIESAVVDGGFKKMSVMKNGDKKSGLPTGTKLKGGNVTMRLTFAVDVGQPPVYQVTHTAPVEALSDGSRRGEGMTFFVNPAEMARAIATPGNNTNPLDGMKSNGYIANVTVWTPDGKIYQVQGGVLFVNSGPKTRFGKKRAEDDYLAYAKGLARTATRGVRRAATRVASAIRKLPQLVRFTGADIHGVEASVVMARSRKTGATSYTVRSFGIHVPIGAPPTPGNEALYVDSPYTESIATKLDADPEDLVHILALAEAIADKADETRAEYAHARETVGPNSVGAKAVETKLTKEMRIHSILMSHANTLRDEESGAADLTGIPPEVEAAIGNARELIGISLLERWRRGRDTMRARKSISSMKLPELKAELLKNVNALENTRSLGNIGTEYLNRARIVQEEIRSRLPELLSDPEVRFALDKLKTFRFTQSADRKAKRDMGKAESDRRKKESADAVRNFKNYGDANGPAPPSPQSTP